MRVNERWRTVAAMDVLGAGDRRRSSAGSQREERLDVLDARHDGCAASTRSTAWYRDLRR